MGGRLLLANNFPQSIGLETDYYDRAMALAYELKKGGLDFEITGHSLAGGMASAAAAVTGYMATTWNAAGLNLETSRRFAQQYGLPLYDVSHNVTAYQVQGELLSDGVQGNIHRMDVIQRAELGGVLKETSALLNELPEGRRLLKQQLDQNMPTEAQAAVHAFVDKLATGDTEQMLRQLPLAAGDVQPALVPMTRLDPDNPASPLVMRATAMPLPDATLLAGPVLETISAAALGARVGERGGQIAAAGGHITQQALHVSGEGIRAMTEVGGQASRAVTQMEGAMAQMLEQSAGGAFARSVDAAGEVEATLEQGLGRARAFGAALDAQALRGIGSALPVGVQPWLDQQAGRLDDTGERFIHGAQEDATVARRQGHAQAAVILDATRALQAGTRYATDKLGQFQHDAIAGSGHRVGSGLDVSGRYIDNALRHAPTVAAATGAAVAADAALALELNPANYPRLAGAAMAIAHARQAGSEAFERHLMKTSVLPSMDGRIEHTEQAARETLQRLAPRSAVHTPLVGQADSFSAPTTSLLLDDPAHPDHVLYQQARRAVHRLDAEHGRVPNQHSDNLAASETVAARGSGLSRIDHVVLSDDATRAFAVQGELRSFTRRLADPVDVSRAINTPISRSSAAWEQTMRQPPQETPSARSPSRPLEPTNQQPAQRQSSEQATGPVMRR